MKKKINLLKQVSEEKNIEKNWHFFKKNLFLVEQYCFKLNHAIQQAYEASSNNSFSKSRTQVNDRKHFFKKKINIFSLAYF